MDQATQAVGQPPPSATLPLVRAQVKDILTKSEAFRALPKDRQMALASDMVKVAHYIVGDSEENAPKAVTLAGPTSAVRAFQPQKPPDPAGDTAGQRFAQAGAVAAQQGVAAYTDLVQKVDFPKFVAGLIHGVFDAIVTSSIKQMEAYAELVKNVAKSVDQYMKDNVSTNQARDYLAGRYPEYLEVDIGGAWSEFCRSGKRAWLVGAWRFGLKRGSTPGCIQAMSSVPDDEWPTFQAESVRGAIHLKSVIGWGFIPGVLKRRFPLRTGRNQ